MTQTKSPVSVIGLGKLGVCMAASFAAKGYRVVGLDERPDIVRDLKQGLSSVQEPMLKECLLKGKDFLSATLSHDEVIRDTDITFVIVPTPSTPGGDFSDLYLRQALEALAVSLKKSQKDYHVFVITSTVSPGTIDSNLIPLIESCSGRQCGKDFGVCYNPEFIALGSVIDDLLNPDFILVGEGDQRSGQMIEKFYNGFCDNNAAIERMNIISAEITKISLNSYITMKISFANSLKNICDGIPCSDLNAITKALGKDKRVSPYYLRGGMSYGGPCFPRDNRAFMYFAREAGIDAKLARATDEVNNDQIDQLLSEIRKVVSSDFKGPVSVLGLSYKPGTPVIEESAGMKIVEKLLEKWAVSVSVYDPLAARNIQAYFGKRVQTIKSLKEAVKHARLCIIATPDTEFCGLSENDFDADFIVVVDPWRLLKDLNQSTKIKYI